MSSGYTPEGLPGDTDVLGAVSRHMGAVGIEGFEGCSTTEYHITPIPGDTFVTAEQLLAERAARETQA